MRRTPEPELMDEPTQAEAYAAADFSEPDNSFINAFLEHFPGVAGRAVDLGCGPGNIARRLAEALPHLDITGVDGSPAMLTHAAARGGHVTWLQAVLPTSLLPDASFDVVVSNSLLHHLHDPAVLWSTIRRIAAPGAAILVGDLRRPVNAEQADNFVQAYAADASEVLKRDFLASLHAAFELDEVQEQLVAAGLEHLTVEAVGNRHLYVWGTAPG